MNTLNSYACACQSTFTGTNCQFRINKCNSNPCQNGGTCLDSGICLCAPGYTGDRCQSRALPNECGPKMCFNGATCQLSNNNEYMCVCAPSFTGESCENQISKTSTTTKSTSSASSSTSSIDMIQKFEKNVSDVHQVVLIVCLGFGLPIIAILIVILLCRIKQTTKRVNNKLAILNQEENHQQQNKNSKEQLNNDKEFQIKIHKVESNEKSQKEVSMHIPKINLIDNNIFDENSEKEKSIYVQTIDLGLSKSEKKFKHLNEYKQTNFNSNRQSNKYDSYNIMASIV